MFNQLVKALGLLGAVAIMLFATQIRARYRTSRNTVAQALPEGGNRSEAAITVRCCPTVRMDLDVYVRLHAYVRTAPGELTLLAASEIDRDRNEIWVRQLFLPVQSCSGSSTVVDEEAMAQVLLEAVQSGVTLDSWIHSHADMDVFFSTTDVKNIQQAFSQSPYVLSIVVNRSGKMLARLTQSSPFTIEVDGVPIVSGLTSELEQAISAEVQQKVRRGNGAWRPLDDGADYSMIGEHNVHSANGSYGPYHWTVQ